MKVDANYCPVQSRRIGFAWRGLCGLHVVAVISVNGMRFEIKVGIPKSWAAIWPC
jgi:hypothetical protein